MTLRQSKNPYAYRDLLVYKKAEELQKACATFTSHFPRSKTIVALADQMDRSARSVKQNIVEGWKRNSTKEYYDFLGFSIGANAELEEDCNDIIKGIYKGLKGMKGVEGEEGGGEEEKWKMAEVEKLPFYPLNPLLPPLIQLKLRCKEINFLLQKLQQSLSSKMQSDHTLSRADILHRQRDTSVGEDRWYKEALKAQGLVRLVDGRIVKGEESQKREKGAKGDI